jgi:hypothetical protein
VRKKWEISVGNAMGIDATRPRGSVLGRSDFGIANLGFGTAVHRFWPRPDRSSRGKSYEEAVAQTMLVPSRMSGELIHPIQNRTEETLPNEFDKGLKLNKRESVKMGRKKRVLLRSYISQPLEELRNNHARHEIGMGIFWAVLALICGGLGWVLLTILLK